MKKLLLFLALAAGTLTAWADEYYLVGGATDSGWTNGEWNRSAVRAYTADGTIWAWAGKLTTGEGDNGRFKLPNVAESDGSWSTGLWATSQDYVLTSEYPENSNLTTNSGGDNKFRVSEEGYYLITFNTSTMKIKAEKLSAPSMAGDYFLISSVNDYYYFAAYIATDDTKNAKARLMTDLSFEGKTFTPMASDKHKFKGEFDGNGHTIDYAKVVSTSFGKIGLFTYVTGGANIHDLIMGENCRFEGTVKTGGISGYARDGGEVTLTNIINKADAVSTAGENMNEGNSAGFIACATDNTIITATNCANMGLVSGQNGQCAAFAGWTEDSGGNSPTKSTFTNCWNSGKIYNTEGTAQLYRNSGKVTATNCFDASTSDSRGQGTLVDASTLASGELCFTLNGDQSSIHWYQNLSGTVDAAPVPFSSHSQVYAVGELKCDGTSAGEDLLYSNSSSSVVPPHTNSDGWCSVCNAYIENGLTANNGWYEIGNAKQLRWMVESVNEHNGTYGSANIKLTGNIDYSAYTDQASMFGKPSNTYRGTFDGQCHTVTVGFNNTTAEETGLFRRINGGTVKNLKVDGTITTTRKLAGGICSGIWQKGKIINCESAVTINDAGTGDATHGGILACVHDKSNTDGGIQILNCLFSGSLNAPNREGSGGIIGWPADGATEVKIYNCLVTGSISLLDDDDNDVIVRNLADVQNTYYSCSLTNNLRNSKSAIAVAEGEAASGALCYKLNELESGKDAWYQNLSPTSPVDAGPTPFSTSANVYANGDFYCDGVTPKGSVTYSNAEGSTIDDHVFENNLCTGCKAVGQEPSNVDGVYQIANIGHLIWFATHVNAGNPTAAGVLTANITQGDAKYTPIGSTINPYKGTFRGNFHTVNMNLTDGSKSNQGIFGVLSGGATIYDLIATGNVKGYNGVGGIAGITSGSGDVKFFNCGNEAEVWATNANAGGILGVDMNSSAKITMKNVYSTGAIKGIHDNGGVSGWAGDNPYMINVYSTSTVENGDQFGRCNGGDNFSNTFGQNQITGTMLTDGQLCAKLGYAFRQNIGSGHPCFDQTLGFVSQIGDARYSTMFNKYSDVEIPDGIEAFAGVKNGDEWLRLIPISENIAKEEPVILRGDAGLYNFMPTSGITGEASNDLKGSTGSIVGDGSTIFALANKGGVGFYLVDNGVVIPEGRVYLEIPGETTVKGFTFIFDDDATGIKSLTPALSEGEGAIYNVAGQRIQKMQKGINIVNGRKVLF